PRRHCAGCWPVGSTRDRPRSLAKERTRSEAAHTDTGITHPLVQGSSHAAVGLRSKPVSVFGPYPAHSELGAVIRRGSMTRHPIRQRECCRIIEENHSE